MSDPYGAIAAPDPYAGIAAPPNIGAAVGQSVAPPQPPNTLADVAQSTLGGFLRSAMMQAQSLNPQSGVSGALQAGMKMAGQPGMAATQAALAPTMEQRGQNELGGIGYNYQPKTDLGRYGAAVGGTLPNLAAGPEGIVPKAASVLVPAVAGQGAADLTKAAGGGPVAQGVAQFAGGLAGGGLAGAAGVLKRAAPQILTQEEQPVAQAIQGALDVTGAHRDDVKAAMGSGTLPAAASPGLTQLADKVTTQPGTGQAILRDAIGQRFAGQTDRALSAIGQHLGVDAQTARGDVDNIVKQGQAAVAPQYQVLTNNPAPVWTNRLGVLAQTPAMKKAINFAVADLQNDPDGPSPTALGFKQDPDTGWTLPKTLDNTEQQPTAATWIKVHQSLGQTVDRNPLTGRVLGNGESPGNANIAKVGGLLRDELAGNPETGQSGAIPGYGDVLGQSGDYLSTRGAFNRASGKLFSGPVADFQQMWSSLQNPSQIKAAQAALANDILTKTEGPSVVPGLFKTPGVQQKMKIAFPDGAPAFLQQMEDDMGERRALGSVIGGPPSASRLVAASTTPPKVGPMRQALRNVTGMADNIASFTHPLTAITKVAKMAAGTSNPKAIPPPWEDPTTNAQLGSLLSNPQQMSAFLDRMAAQKTANYQAARTPGLLQGSQIALPGLLSGLLSAPAASAATQGQTPQ